MKKQSAKFTSKDKRIFKQSNIKKAKKLQNDDDEIASEESVDEPQPNQQQAYQKYQTPEEVKHRLAKEVISKFESKKSKIKDDFFFVEDNIEEENKHIQIDEDEAMAEKLKMQYLKKQNKLYQLCDESFYKLQTGVPIEYRGHTKCITAFQLTSTQIFSCSKDRSIIKWDRQTQKKDFISLGKDKNHHQTDILCMSLHSNQNVLATAGEDFLIKLWDTRSNQLVQTMKGHKNHVNGIKFGANSNNLCSVSSDLTFKQWDFAQRGLIETFYEHNAEVLDIDCFNGNDFLTSGNDHQTIAWKTQKQTKIVFKGHEYAIDRVRTINHQKFVTACQDGSLNLWCTKRNKPVFKFNQAHPKGWISAMDNLKQTNVFATGGIDRIVKIWGIEGDLKGIRLLKQIEVKGIVTDLKMRQNCIAVTQCDELRLGRWVTDKCRNKIKIFPLIQS